jgi:hypothetical protein
MKRKSEISIDQNLSKKKKHGENTIMKIYFNHFKYLKMIYNEMTDQNANFPFDIIIKIVLTIISLICPSCYCPLTYNIKCLFNCGHGMCIPCYRLELLYKNLSIPETCNLCGSIISVIEYNTPDQLFIKKYGSKELFSINVNLVMTTFNQIKRSIHLSGKISKHILIDEINLIAFGKRLSPGLTCADYGIKEKETIYLTLGLRGD